MIRKQRLLIVLLLAFLAYVPIVLGYFQQDEWLVFARYYVLANREFIANITQFFAFDTGHYVPFSRLTSYVLFLIFKINYLPYALFSLGMHLTTTALLYHVLNKVFKDKFLAFMGTLIFAINPSITQATYWVIANINTQGATLFGLLAFLYTIKYLEAKDARIAPLVKSMVFFLFSLLFKEITIALVFLLPLYSFLFYRGEKKKNTVLISVFLLTGFLYVILRGIMILSSEASSVPLVTQSQSKSYILQNFLLYPIYTLAQSIIPASILLLFSKGIAQILVWRHVAFPEKGTVGYEVYIFQTIFRYVNFAIFLIVSLFVFLARKGKYIKFLLFAFVWVITNSLIFVLSPERSDVLSFVDSRNLYFASIGTAILIVFSLHNMHRERLTRIILVLIVITFLAGSIWTEYPRLQMGQERKEIIVTIHNLFPDLPDKTILYTESDKSFYGLSGSERIFPFQSGFGLTFLVSYFKTERFPDDFLEGKYFWDLTEQGYKETNEKLFAYVRDFDKLVKIVDEKKLPLTSVISLSYENDNHTVRDNSQEVRGRIVGALAEKREVEPNKITLFSKNNQNNLEKILDRDIETYWDSLLPYANPQSIDIVFSSKREIAEIDLNIYTNKDQNESGFRVLVMKDDTWKQVLYIKRLDQEEDGIFRLYFEPSITQTVRIQQIGGHKYANWIIHELTVYEKIN